MPNFSEPKMKRKYQVFISSTFGDLAAHRKQALMAIVEAGHLPLALEYHGPDPMSKLDVIREAIAECQFYVIILGHRYGSIGSGQEPGRERGYVEHELEYAEGKGLKILAFVMPKNHVISLRNELKRPDDSEEINSEEKYWKLYKRLTDGVGSPFFRPFQSAADIHKELYAFFKCPHDDVKGYIPEPLAEEDTDILRISGSNEILREAIQRLGQFKFVDPRLSISKEKKIALARAFCQLHGDHIRDVWKKVFIESGSTLAYVAWELCSKLPKMGSGGTDRKVLTNNSLAYLYLWLCSGVLCHPEPEGPPDTKYGGMYGALTDRDRSPDYSGPPLVQYDPDADTIIERMEQSIFGDETDNERSILLTAASALQLSDRITAVDKDDPSKPVTDEEVLSQLRRCRGFHGGSYQNRLFKLGMFRTQIPAFVFIHDAKIDCPVRVGICHFLCDTGYPWEAFIGEYPLSIWVACDRATIKDICAKMTTYLVAGDWRLDIYGGAESIPIVLAHNASFRQACHKIGVRLYDTALQPTSGSYGIGAERNGPEALVTAPGNGSGRGTP